MPRRLSDSCAVVAAKVAHDNPDVTIVAVAPERFAGEFAISATNYVLDAAGEQGLRRSGAPDQRVLRPTKLPISSPSIPMRALKSAAPSAGDAESRLRQDFAFWKEGTSSERAAANVSYVRGHYAAQRERLQRKLFPVNAVPGNRQQCWL